jgi:hypothetical protein
MPRMDGTGPEGKGSGTGRRSGHCRKNTANGYVIGRGRRQGNRRMREEDSGNGRRKQKNQQN